MREVRHGSNRDSLTLAEFVRRAPELVEQLKETGEPIVLTINGKATVVVQDVRTYRQLFKTAEEARRLEGIHKGLEDMRAGRTVPLGEFKKEVQDKHGIKM